MATDFLGYDAARVRELGRQVVRSIEYLDGIRSSEPCADGAITTIRDIAARLSTEWLPALATITGDTTLFGWSSGGPSVGLAGSAPGGAGGLSLGGLPAAVDSLSDADLALIDLADRFDDLDTNGDGGLSWGELVAGADSDDPAAAACAYLVGNPLAFANTALAGADYSIGDLDVLSIDNIEDGGWEVDMDPHSDAPMWQSMTLTTAAIASALEQNRHQRTLARPSVFAAADGADDDGEIDGRVSLGDLEALSERTDDPAVTAMCAYFLANVDAFKRIDREGPGTGFDGAIAYDQLFELGTRQGALAGLADPAIPAALQALYREPVDHGDGATQFLHHPVEPQPGLGHVVVALYVPTPTAGVTQVEGVPVLGDWAVGAGNDRVSDPTAHPSDSMLHLIVDYESGMVTVRIPPSVGLDGGVSDALPIVTDLGSGGLWFGRLTPAGDSNHVSIDQRDDGAMQIDWAILNADKRVVAPWADGTFTIAPADGSQVRFLWVRDRFPALEAYHIYPDGTIETLADDPAGNGAMIGLLDDFPPTAGAGVG